MENSKVSNKLYSEGFYEKQKGIYNNFKKCKSTGETHQSGSTILRTKPQKGSTSLVKHHIE